MLQSQPGIREGVNYLEKPRKLSVFQAFLASEFSGSNSKAVWIDSQNEASTYALSAHGSPSLLEKVEIGRAFTAFQHHSLIQQLEEFIDQETDVLVLPNFDSLYLDGQVKEWEAKELFRESWRKIREVQEKYSLKVLVSTAFDSQLSRVIQTDAVQEIEVEPTSQGWKYSSDDFDQMMYGESNSMQTTLPYWENKTSEEIRVTAREA